MEVRVLMRARNYYCLKARRTKSEQYRRLRNLVVQKEKLRYFEVVSEESVGNPERAWKEISRLRTDGG